MTEAFDEVVKGQFDSFFPLPDRGFCVLRADNHEHVASFPNALGVRDIIKYMMSEDGQYILAPLTHMEDHLSAEQVEEVKKRLKGDSNA